MKGIDISSNNHRGEVFNFAAVKAAGYDFVYVKATQGVTYLNPYLIADVRDAHNAGLKVGVYHFFDRSGTPEEQAKFFNDNGIHQPVGEGHTNLSQFLTLKPVLDYEQGGVGDSANATEIQAFNLALGRHIGLYTDQDFEKQLGGYAGCYFGWLAIPGWQGGLLPSVTAIVQTGQQQVQGIGENPNGSHATTDIDVLTDDFELISDEVTLPTTTEEGEEIMDFHQSGGQDHLYVYQPNKSRTVHYWQNTPGTAPDPAPADFYKWESEVLPEPA